jgi:NADPH-dependent F420 reductase
MPEVTIIGGTGDQGSGLALRWALAGKSLVVGSRDTARAAQSAERLRAAVQAAGRPVPEIAGYENAQAASLAPVVVITVPLAAQATTARSIREALQPGTLVVDVTVPVAAAIGGRASRMLGLPAGSAAQQLVEYLPSTVRVASAFHFLSADRLADPSVPLDCDVIGCGGDAAAQETLRELAESIPGVRYLHAGPLGTASLLEAAATLLIAINVRHKSREAGLRITGIPAIERSSSHE